MGQSIAGVPIPKVSAEDWPRLLLGALAVLTGVMLQSPQTLTGEPLAHLILVGTGAALILHRVRDPALAGPRAPWLGVALAGAAAALAFAAPLGGALKPALIGLAVALLALSLVANLLGRRVAAALAVPMLVVYVLVPVLPLFESALSYPMRRLSAILAAALFSIGPAQVGLQGTELMLGDLKVSVTSACSGLTLLQNLIWVAWWTVLLRHRGFLPRLLHLGLAVPAVVVANTLRVVALALMAQALGEESLTGPGHVVIGWAAVVLAALIFLGLEQLFAPTAPAGREDAAPASGL
jgi:exosortase/archaeosortase family protein